MICTISCFNPAIQDTRLGLVLAMASTTHQGVRSDVACRPCCQDLPRTSLSNAAAVLYPMISLLQLCWLMTLSAPCLQGQCLRALTSQDRPVPLRLAHPVPSRMLPAAQLSQHPESLSPGTCSHSETPAYATHTNHRAVHRLKHSNTALQSVCT